MGSDHRLQHLGNGLLLGGRQRLDALQLLRDLRLRPALAGGVCGLHAGEFFHAHAQGLAERDERGHGHAQRAALVVRQRLLSDAQLLGQLHLGQAHGLAPLGDARTSPRAWR